MAWQDVNPMEERVRFVLKAGREEIGFSELCRQFGVSRKTGTSGWRGVARAAWTGSAN
jgi:hypothetical protein